MIDFFAYFGAICAAILMFCAISLTLSWIHDCAGWARYESLRRDISEVAEYVTTIRNPEGRLLATDVVNMLGRLHGGLGILHGTRTRGHAKIAKWKALIATGKYDSWLVDHKQFVVDLEREHERLAKIDELAEDEDVDDAEEETALLNI